jgi:two-component system, LuxR family, sensor kinase FixL
MKPKATTRRSRPPRAQPGRELRGRLPEAEETLRAIRGGAVDAFVVRTRHGDQVFTLQGAEHPYRVLVEEMENGAATVSTDGTILYANRCLAAMLGTALERLVGASIYACIRPTDQPTVRALLEYGRTGARRAEATLCAADGTSVPVTLAANLVRTAEPETVCLILTDLTNRKQIEEQTRQHQAELAHVLRLSTMGELAAELAHGINQPLAAIANDVAACVTYVRSGKAVSRKLLNLLEHAAAEASDAGNIVHHLREFVQKRRSHLEATNLNRLVRTVARLLEAEIVEREITLQLDLAPRPLPVYADRIEIEQVLVNLIQNAIDAVREAGSARKRIYVQTRKTKDGMAEVTVRDIGRGFSQAAAKRLFEAFFTTKAQGLGMGLAISHSIIEAHQGRIWREPVAGNGRGATMRFALPLQAPGRARKGRPR